MSRNVFDGNQVTLRDIPDLIKFAQRHNKALYIMAGFGVGKSETVKQVANVLFGKREDNLIDIRLSDKEPTDVVGVQIPYTDDKGVTRSAYATPSFWPTDPDWKGIIFLDELAHAEPYLQKVAFQILLDHRIGEFVFPKGAVYVSAGNRQGDGGVVNDLEPGLANRVIMVEVKVSLEVWLEDYALLNGVHPSLIGYLKSKPSALDNYGEMMAAGSPSFASPRSVVTVSMALKDYDKGILTQRLTKTIIQGCVGKAFMEELWVFHTKRSKLTPIQHIMDGSVTNYMGTISADILWMIGSEGCMVLRSEIMDDELSDEVVLEHAKNFLEYLHSNFGEENADFVSSVFMSFIKKNAFGEALLTGNNKRSGLPAKMLSQCPAMKEVMMKYISDYSTIVKDVN